MEMNATAHIARNKSRLKSYGERVYLKNGDTFEIELFNGYTTEVMAKIWINDELISESGIVLKPGQRYFLERFIDTNNRFKFDTYEVENTGEVKEAIKNNGKVRVEFYKKTINQTSSIYNPYLWSQIHNNNITYTNHIKYSTSDFTTTGVGDMMFTTDANVNYETLSEPKGSLETGRIEKGGTTNQSFETVNMEFNTWSANTVEWQILPASQQPVEVSQIRNYCSGCGTRIKKQSWKFCPTCGEQLD